MFKFSKTKFAKATSAVVGVMTAVMMLGPVASAATVDELMAMIATLQAQIATLNGGSTSGAMMAKHTFNTDLTVGSKGADVTALQEILVSKGYLVMPAGVAMGYFGNATKAAVMKWQAAAGITPAAGYVGPKSRAALNAMGGSMTTTPGTTPAPAGVISGMVDVSSPVASSIIKGTSMKIAAFKITNNGSASAKVTSVKLKRTGLSSDNSIRNVYIYNGANRITDAATVAQGMATFNDAAGIVSIPAGTNVVLGIMVEVDSSAATGEQIGFALNEVVTDVGAVTGLPANGNNHQVVATISGMTGVSFNSTTNPSTACTTGSCVDPQSDYVVWQNTVNIQSRDALLSSIRFRQIGSASPGDLKNFRLFVGGTQVGSAVEMVGNNGYVTFDFSAAPITLKSGGREMKVLADIVGGSNKTFQLSLQQAVDAQFWDSQLNVVVAPVTSPSSTTFSSVFAQPQLINPGQLTVTKSTDSPSGNVVNQGSSIVLAKFDFKGAGERLKVENLKLGFSSSDSAVTKIRNVAIFVGGVQVGSTQDLIGNGAVSATTTYNLGSSLVVEAGKTTTVEVRGDVFDNDGTNNLNNADTLRFAIAAGSSNVYKMASYGYLSLPASDVWGNQVTVTDGAMTLSKYSAYANQTVTVPQTAFKVGEFRLQAGSTEGINLSSLTIDLTPTTTASVLNIQDMYVMYGTKTTVVKSSVTGTGNTFSINEVLAANATMDIKVFATLNAALSATQVVAVNLAISGTSQNAGNSISASNIQGQNVTIGTGNISATLDASTPVAALAVANSQPKVASFKFTGTNDAFTITELYATTTANSQDVVASLIWKDGATTVATTPLSGNVITTTGLNIAVLANSTKVVDAYLQLGSVGTPGNGATGRDVKVALTGYKYRNSSGVETATTSPALAGGTISGTSQYVYKTKPTLSNVALPSTTLAAGTQTLGKVTVSSDTAGAIEFNKISFNITKSGSFSLTTGGTSTQFFLYDDANQGTPLLATITSTGDLSGAGSAGVVTFVLTTPQGVSGSKTYVLKATLVGAVSTGNSLSTNVLQGSTASAVGAYATIAGGTSSFVWSDLSTTPHDLTSTDWISDYLVKNLPTDSQTLTK